MKRVAGCIRILLLFVLISGCGLTGNGNKDQAVLDQLRDAGSDLAKPHPFHFYLYHPDAGGAEQLCSALRTDGFHVRITESAGGSDWLCLASFTMLPTIENLTELQARFEVLMDQYGGEYDGWETIVIP